MKKPDYANWVSTKLMLGSGALVLLFVGLSFAFPVLAIGAVLLFVVFTYFAYARCSFSPRGGNLQVRIRDLVSLHLHWEGVGEALDIGCGNGPLAIDLAKKYPGARVTGIDHWGGMWEYSQRACERNAEAEGVAERVTFQKASASALPFGDGTFDAAVSNFVFHEVRDTRDKRDVVKEALRVLKKGGVFAFQDLFLVKKMYGEIDDLLETIGSWGVGSVEFAKTRDSNFIPKALKLPFMVGTMGVIYGRK